MRINAVIVESELENDEGRTVAGVTAVCVRCGHETESFGTGTSSVKRCLVLMREECPKGQSNFYVSKEEEYA